MDETHNGEKLGEILVTCRGQVVGGIKIIRKASINERRAFSNFPLCFRSNPCRHVMEFQLCISKLLLANHYRSHFLHNTISCLMTGKTCLTSFVILCQYFPPKYQNRKCLWRLSLRVAMTSLFTFFPLILSRLKIAPKTTNRKVNRKILWEFCNFVKFKVETFKLVCLLLRHVAILLSLSYQLTVVTFLLLSLLLSK